MPTGSTAASDGVQTVEHDVEMLDDDIRSIAERRPRRMNRRLPARYRDVLPQPPPPMAIPALRPPSPEPQVPLSVASSDLGVGSTLVPRALRFFTTLANSFGLSRRYYGDRVSTHDPEDAMTLQHLTLTPPTEEHGDSAEHVLENRDASLFYPYPNKSSFLLGDWYWNGGTQKSKESFKNLIKIVGSSEFQPEDVSSMRWNSINAQLRAGREEAGPEQPFAGPNWTKTAVNIKVPFHKRTAKPGVYDYYVGDIYHRTIISVIREKLSNPQHDELFHYQPYNLLWHRGGSPTPINVHGELYMSEAFIQTH